jgi:acetylornithine aminotransferase
MKKKDVSPSWNDLMMANYGTPTRTFVSGKGCIVTDDQGKNYLDFLAGIATNVLGHGHPAVVKAVSTQIATLGHVSNFFSHPQGLRLASRLQKMTGDSASRVFFRTYKNCRDPRRFSWQNNGCAFDDGTTC